MVGLLGIHRGRHGTQPGGKCGSIEGEGNRGFVPPPEHRKIVTRQYRQAARSAPGADCQPPLIISA
jgi:hypothetical protein